MPAWILLLVALVLLLVDLFVFGAASVVLLILAFGVFFAAVASALGIGIGGQIVAAGIGCLVGLPLALQLSRRQRARRAGTVTDSRIDGSACKVVTERGRLGVRVLGDFYPAREESQAELAQGDRVRVVRFEGITAIVHLIEGAMPPEDNRNE